MCGGCCPLASPTRSSYWTRSGSTPWTGSNLDCCRESAKAGSPGKDLASPPRKDLASTSGKNLVSTPGKDLARSPGRDLVSTPGKDHVLIPGKDLASTPQPGLAPSGEQGPHPGLVLSPGRSWTWRTGLRAGAPAVLS